MNVISNDNTAALMSAVLFEQIETVKLLVENGADVNVFTDSTIIKYDRTTQILNYPLNCDTNIESNIKELITIYFKKGKYYIANVIAI